MRPIAGTITDPAVDRELFPPQRATGSALLDLARALAVVAHTGQSRKGSGEPYVNHVQRVASRVAGRGWRAQTIALLHDTVEDTPVTADTLFEVGFPLDIVNAVLALSRRPDETYFDFIGRTIAEGDDDTLAVKLADLQDNLNDIGTVWHPGSGMARRYEKARALLLEAVESRRTAA